MGVYSYLYRRLKLFNNERFEKHISIISQNTGKSKVYIKFNWFINLILYGTGYTDYYRGDYINLTRKEKKTFVTAKSFYKILRKLNDKEDKIFLSDKVKFDNLFREFLKRDFVDLREIDENSFVKFFEEKQTVFAKPIDGFGGHSIEKLEYSPTIDFHVLYEKLKDNKKYLIEEAIKQSKELNEINPNAVNSYRVVTLYNDEKAYVIGNALRVNQGTDQVIGCTDDLYFSFNEDGIIDSNVVDDYGNTYEKHPLTGKVFKEVKVPQVKEAFEMCKKAALKLPKVRYIGWDVAFSEKGPCLIEGNENPGYGILQFYKLKGSRTGHKKQIEDIIGKI